MTDQEIEIKIKAEASKATSEIKKLNKEVARLSKVNKKAAASSKQVTESYKSFSSSIVKLASGFLALGTATKAIEFATMAADADQAAQSFTDVVTKMGGDSVAEFEKIKEASAGLISEAELNQAATTALLLGVPLSKLAELMEVARAKSREMGTDISTEFNNLATEIGRSSEMTADSLGKTVGELSKQEKALASTNEIIKAAAESVDSLNGSADTSKEKIKKMNTAISDLKVEVGRGLLPAIIELTEKTTEFIKSLSDADIEKMKEGIVSLTSVVVTLGKGFGVVVTGLAEIIKVFDVFFQRALHKDPSVRFGSASELHAAFRCAALRQHAKSQNAACRRRESTDESQQSRPRRAPVQDTSPKVRSEDAPMEAGAKHKALKPKEEAPRTKEPLMLMYSLAERAARGPSSIEVDCARSGAHRRMNFSFGATGPRESFERKGRGDSTRKAFKANALTGIVGWVRETIGELLGVIFNLGIGVALFALIAWMSFTYLL